MANINCFFENSFKDKSWKSPTEYSVFLDFKSSPAAGQIRFHFPKATLNKLYNGIMHLNIVPDCASLLDCIGEISNVSYGNAKRILHGRGFSLNMALPHPVKTKNLPELNICHPQVIIPFKIYDEICFIEILFLCDDINGRMGDFEKLRRLETLIQNSPDAVTFQDLSGNIMAWNQAAESMYGYSRVEALGMNIMDLVPIEFQEETREFTAGVLRGEQMIQLETKRKTKDGKILDVLLTHTKLTYDYGKLTGTFATARDITARKTAAAELKKLHEELESRVKARTEWLESEKLAADSANQAKSRFLANMSHEIRNNLSVIIGFSEILATSEVTSPKKLNFNSAIKRNGEMLTIIINDILDLSKVEAGKIEIEVVETNLSDIYTDLSYLFAGKAMEKGIKLNFSIEKNVPPIIGTDPNRLKQILINLIGNAIKFTEHGSVDVTLKLLQNLDNSDCVAFVVKDTGCGLTQEEADKLFQHFSQADSTINRRYGGIGLGLALSKQLARLLGGDIVLSESVPEIGSTFMVTVDSGVLLKSFKKEITNKLNIQVSSDTDSTPRLDGIKVLFVEDSEDSREFIGWVLSEAGAQVDFAENGRVALEKIRHETYNLILMDLEMPVLGGYATVTEVRNSGYKMPIVALTAHALKEERERCLAGGFDGYLSKPIERAMLLKSIIQLIAPL